jgi:hypothetical protein
MILMEQFIPIRLGIAEHLLRGDISTHEFGIYVLIHLQADYSAGIWRGCAGKLVHAAPRGADLRKTQRAIEHLTALGLLKPFRKRGRRGNYPVLISKYTVRTGALKGKRLNAALSNDWRRPVYETCAENGTESVAEDAPIQEVKEGKEVKTPSGVSADVARIELETKEVAFQAFWNEFPRKEAKAAARRAWLKVPIAEHPLIIPGLERARRSNQWSRDVIPHASTWLNGKRWEDEILEVPKGVSNVNRNGGFDPVVAAAACGFGKPGLAD